MRKCICLSLILLSITIQPLMASTNIEEKTFVLKVWTENELNPRVAGKIFASCYDSQANNPIKDVKLTFRGCGVDITTRTGDDGSATINVAPRETGEIIVHADASHLGYKNIESTKITVKTHPLPPELRLDSLPDSTTDDILNITGITEPGSEIRLSLVNKELLNPINYGKFDSVATVGPDGNFKVQILFPNKTGEYVIAVEAKKNGLSTRKTIKITYTPSKKTYTKISLKLDSKTMTVNGVDMAIKNAPTRSSPPLPSAFKGNAFMPLRPIMDSIKAKITWDGDKKTITICRQMKNLATAGVVLTIGSTQATANGKSEWIDKDHVLYPVIIGGNTYCPVRYVLEALYGKVEFDEKTGKINITIEE